MASLPYLPATSQNSGLVAGIVSTTMNNMHLGGRPSSSTPGMPPSSAAPPRSLPPQSWLPFDTSEPSLTPILTPAIQQQESILTSLSASDAASAAASAAAAAAAVASEDEELAEGPDRAPSSSSPVAAIALGTMERGNGWALLNRSGPFTARFHSTSRLPSLGLHTASKTQILPIQTTHADGMIDVASSSIHPSSTVSRPSPSRQSVASSSSFNVAVDCHDGIPKLRSSEVHSHYGSSAALHNSLPTVRELPAEGTGLRGKDETQAVEQDQEGIVLVDPAHMTDARGPGSHTRSNILNGALASPARKLCIRHQRMPDEGTVGKLQRSIEALPLADQTAVNTAWSLFSSSSHARRALILQGILSMCCFSQLSFLSSELALAIRIDPFCLFPREVSLKVLGHLDAISLGRAAQVSKIWRALADDDLIWRNMCEQHIQRKCEKCGWGLPLLSERRRRLKGMIPAAGTPESRQLIQQDCSIDSSGETRSPSTELLTGGTGNLKRSITAAANAAALEKQCRTAHSSRTSSPASTSRSREEVDADTTNSKRQRTDAQNTAFNNQAVSAHAMSSKAANGPVTRPWKSVYCERLAIERNWRRGRYSVRPLKGHTDGIMCLQFHEALSHPTFPVIISGSYDRTARVWNMDTGEELRVLRGHTRGVRCLQFDEAKLITGSMDRTLKIWNWRTGDLIRTLEGHTEGIVCLNFNDHLLASGSADSNIKIWNFKTGQCFTLRGHTDWVNSVCLWSGLSSKQVFIDSDDAANNTFLFSASDDGTIRLWDLANKECLMVYSGHVGQTQGLSLVHMAEEVVEMLALGGNVNTTGDNEVARSQRGLSVGRQHQDAATRQFQSLNHASYYAPTITAPLESMPDTSSRLADMGFADGGPDSGIPNIPERFYDAPAFGQHPTALRKLSESQSRKIEPHLLKLHKRLHEAGLVPALPLGAEMGDLEWGTTRRRVLQVQGHSLHSNLSLDSAGAAGTKVDGANLRRQSSRASSNGPQKLRPMLFSCSLDNTIKIWDVRTGLCIRTLFGHMAGLWALSTDRLRLATASHDSTLKIWELATGKHLFSILEHRGPVTCVQIGDDKVVSGSDDGQVNIYSFTTS